VTDIAAGRLHRVSKVIVHPLTVRVTHWLNALAMVIMIMSGWRIYNSEPIFPFHFPIALTLGGSFDGSVDLHNEDGLAGALQWHFAGMWLLAINGIVYVTLGFATGRFRRKLLPITSTGVLSDLKAALTFKLAHDDLSTYNYVQKLLYAGIIAVGVVIVLSGLSIWKPVQLQYLTALFGGYDIARYVHFICMALICLFLIVHVALALLVPKSLRAMIIGR